MESVLTVLVVDATTALVMEHILCKDAEDQINVFLDKMAEFIGFDYTASDICAILEEGYVEGNSINVIMSTAEIHKS